MEISKFSTSVTSDGYSRTTPCRPHNAIFYINFHKIVILSNVEPRRNQELNAEAVVV